MHPPIGIDLGTTNSLVAAFQGGAPTLLPNRLGKYLTPSVVSLDGKTLMAGEPAKSRLVSHPSDTAALFKRAMGTEQQFNLGRKTFSAVDLSAVLLGELKADAEAALGSPVSDVVISVPAYFNEVQRKATIAAARIAGLTPQRLINEPTAAALAYGLQDLDAESMLMVFDLGGGTFDVSILEVFEGVMEVKATAGDAFLGGEDFTNALAGLVAKKTGQASIDVAPLREVADRIKIGLTDRAAVDFDVEVDGQRLKGSVDREELEEATENLLARLRRPVLRALHDADLSVDEIDRVVLVGGATRMPVIRSLVARQTRKMPEMRMDPDHVVALGAAVQAGLIDRDAALDDVVMTDVNAFSLGLEMSRMVGNVPQQGYFMPIIDRNTVVPVSREESVSTVEMGQTSIRLNVYQGEAPVVSSNIFLGSLQIKVPRNPKAHEEVRVRFTYDSSGLLEVDATVVSTGKQASLVIRQLVGDMDDAEIRGRLTALQKLKVHPREDAENLALRSRIEQCYAMARLDQRDLVQNMLVVFDSAVAGQDLAEIERVRAEITAELDLFEAEYV